VRVSLRGTFTKSVKRARRSTRRNAKRARRRAGGSMPPLDETTL